MHPSCWSLAAVAPAAATSPAAATAEGLPECPCTSTAEGLPETHANNFRRLHLGRRSEFHGFPIRIQAKSGPHGLARTLAGQGPTGGPLASLPTLA